MSQHDFDITTLDANTGPTMRAAINAALQAQASNNSGATAPTTTYPFMWWADTTTGYLKQRNSADSAWIIKGKLADAYNALSEAFNEAKGADIASATTTDIGASAGNYVKVTGTTTITGLGTVQAGSRRIVEFTGALTLTHNATSLILPTGANITTTAGDVATFVSLGSGNWKCVGYQRADGSPLVSTGSQHGQCRLIKSGSNLVLQPLNGNKIIINGTAQAIPSAGVSLAPPATNGTLYYIYAYMNSGTMTLEYSTTTHATDSTTGVEIKSGDATRTLVGMARTVSSAWVDTAIDRLVISWFNRRRLAATKMLASNTTISWTSYAELSSSDRASFLCWAGDNTEYFTSGSCYLNSGAGMQTACNRDGSTVNPSINYCYGTGSGQYWGFSPRYMYPGEVEGYHTASTSVAVGGSTSATWVGSGYTVAGAIFEG